MSALRAWSERDPPPGDLLIMVAGFGTELERNPEAEADLEQEPLLFRLIPGTEHDGRIVSITFVLGNAMDTDVAGEVRCKDIVCVPHPQQHLFLVWPPEPHHR